MNQDEEHKEEFVKAEALKNKNKNNFTQLEAIETQLVETKKQNWGLLKVDIDIQEFKEIIADITQNSSVLALKEHEQHKNSSRYEHCYDVAYYTYVICKKLGLDYISATRGAMLHDFYFYDWRNKGVDGQKRFHAYRHPRISLNNASENFDLNDVEKDVILKHMWPLTLSLPRYAESYVVTFVDKYCATREFFGYYKHKRHIKKLEKLTEINHSDKKEE